MSKFLDLLGHIGLKSLSYLLWLLRTLLVPVVQGALGMYAIPYRNSAKISGGSINVYTRPLIVRAYMNGTIVFFGPL